MSARHSFDTILIGGGAMGSAAAWQLTARGQRVLVLDRFRPPHPHGSTHGETRVIREAYFEHPAYVPLVQRAYDLWRELEPLTGKSLLRITGGLMIGPPEGVVFNGARTSAEQHGLPHEILGAGEIQRRFPALRIPEQFQAVLEPRAGILMVEACVAACLDTAAHHGACLRFDEPVTSWRAMNGRVEVVTDQGVYSAGQLVLAAGSWVSQLVPQLAPSLRVERQVLHWFQPTRASELHTPDRLPVHVVEYEAGRFFYALPDVETGVKAALHHQGATASPDAVCREVTPAEQADMGRLAGGYLPGLAAMPHRSVTCLYTNTPDEHFLIDHHPEHAQVLIVSPCSGHGFKFASAIGEVVADLVTAGRSRFDLSRFKLDRLGNLPA
jgi:sarcosine oxidase